MRVSTESLQRIVKNGKKDKNILINSMHLAAMANEILQYRGFAPVKSDKEHDYNHSSMIPESVISFHHILRGWK